MDTSEWIFATHKCCSCDKPIKETATAHVNLIQLDRKATWDYPTFGNVMQGTSGIAGAIQCDPCLESKAPIKRAIEYRGNGKKKTVIYHEVDQLEKIVLPEPEEEDYDSDYDVFE